MSKHVDVVAWLNIALSGLGLMGAAIVFFTMIGAGLLSGDAEAMFVTSTVAVVISVFLLLVSVPGLIAGVGLLKRAEWARILMLVVACFQLLNVPLGTALAIYTFWALLQDETKWMFARAG